MPILDKYWWLRILGALTLLALMGQAWIQIIGDDVYLGYIGPSPNYGEIALDLLLGAVTLAITGIIAVSAIPARRRKLRRIAAIHGDPEAIPLARTVYEDIPYDLEREPLIIQQFFTARTDKPLFVITVVVYLVGALGVGTLSVSVLADLAHDITTNGITQHDLALIPLLISIATAYVVLVVVLIRCTPTLLGKPFGVVIEADGIRYRTWMGHTTFLRWDDARIFEAHCASTLGTLRRPYSYRLYGEHAEAVWYDPYIQDYSIPAPANTPDGAILAVRVVRDKTGLAPRTFVKGLQVRDEGEITAARSVSQLR
jgi:hypothetical protein